jgi:hypothetical protein
MSHAGPDPGDMSHEEMYSRWPPGTTQVLIGPDRECVDFRCHDWWHAAARNYVSRPAYLPFWEPAWLTVEQVDKLLAWCATLPGWSEESRTEYAPHPLKVFKTR